MSPLLEVLALFPGKGPLSSIRREGSTRFAGPFDDVLELPDTAWPGMSDEYGQGFL
jgi:hypothetical protein